MSFGAHAIFVRPSWSKGAGLLESAQVFTPEGERCCSSSLLVNAWDPWSFVGNGNAGDNSHSDLERVGAAARSLWSHWRSLSLWGLSLGPTLGALGTGSAANSLQRLRLHMM